MTVHTRASDTLPAKATPSPARRDPTAPGRWSPSAESSGNPIGAFFHDAFSDDGNRAVYGIAGGTPLASTGSLLSPYFAERTEAGWQTRPILPPRDQLVGQTWDPYVYAAKDLSTMVTALRGADSGVLESQLWRFTPGAGPALLHHQSGTLSTFPLGISADGTRAIGNLNGAFDPTYPAAGGVNVYELRAGTPRLLSLLPGEALGPCGGSSLQSGPPAGDSNWVSADGSLVYFHADPTAPCGGLILTQTALPARSPRRGDQADLRPAALGPRLRRRPGQSDTRRRLLRHQRVAWTPTTKSPLTATARATTTSTATRSPPARFSASPA